MNRSQQIYKYVMEMTPFAESARVWSCATVFSSWQNVAVHVTIQIHTLHRMANILQYV